MANLAKITLVASVFMMEDAVALQKEVQPWQISNIITTPSWSELKSRILAEDDAESGVDDETVDDQAEFTGQTCETTADCGKSRFLVCKEASIQELPETLYVCSHKSIFPMRPIEIVGTIVLTLLMALAVMSGIGGGGIIVPLLMVFYKLETKGAIAVSGFTILIGSLSRFFMTYKVRHPEKDATCIEYSVTNVMLPCVLIGSVAGVFFNIIFPSVIIQISLTLLLLFLSLQSIFKAKSIYDKENKEMEKKKNQQPESEMVNTNFAALPEENSSVRKVPDQEEVNIVKVAPEERAETNDVNKVVEGDSQEKENIEKTQQIIDLEKTHFQWAKQGTNFAIFIILLFINLYRGSKKNPSMFGIVRCSGADWTSLVIFVILCSCISYYSVRKIQYEQMMKVKYGPGLASCDIDMKGSNLRTLIIFSILGGWVSGAMGLGGGAIFNPLLLSMGLPPKVASSSGMYMIIFATGASTMTYILNGMLDVGYGLWVGGFCFLGTFFGMRLLDSLMKKFDRQSPLVMLLAFIFIISVIAVPIFGVQQLKGVDNLWELTNICS